MIYIIIGLFFSCTVYISKDNNTFVNSNKTSLKEKVAQMIMIRMDGKYHNNESWKKRSIEDLIKNYKIGGLITFSGSVHGTYKNIHSFQNLSQIPLFIASDYERGLGVFIDGTLFPSNIAVAAT